MSIPLTLYYNFKIYKKFYGAIKAGPTLNFEISSKYNYPNELSNNNSKSFIGLSFEATLNYDIGKSTLFLGLEPYFGAKRAKTTGEDMNGLLQTQNYLMKNILINIGIKYKLK